MQNHAVVTNHEFAIRQPEISLKPGAIQTESMDRTMILSQLHPRFILFTQL